MDKIKNNLNFSKKKLLQKIKANPNDLNSILTYGKLMGLQNDHLEAANIFEKSIINFPNSDTLKFNYAISLIAIKKFYKGALILQNLLSKFPYKNEILFSYANALYKLKKYKLSLKYYYKLYYLDKTNVNVLINIGIVLISLESYSKALIFLKLANNEGRQSSLILRNIGLCYKNLNNINQAINYYKNSIDLEKSYIGSYLALGSIYLEEKENDLAINTFQTASNIAQNIIKNYKSNNVEEVLLNDIAILFSILGNYNLAEKSIKILEEKFLLKASHKMLLSEVLLSKGNFEEGWSYYEYRFDYYLEEKNINNFKNFPKPLWNEDLGNEAILIWSEQGLGDQILFGTILEDFILKFKKVYLMVDPRLKNFYSKFLKRIEIVGSDEYLNSDLYDYHIPLGSIAKYSRKTIYDFKTINLNFFKNLNWKNISIKRKLKCAVSWKSVNSFKSKYKSIKLKELNTIFKNPKIDFYNIQYTDEKRELNELKKEFDITIKKPNDVDALNDIDGLMKFIDSCDFVISVSNTNAHISGILNKPTLLLLPKIYGTWWYWHNEFNNKNIWYPSIKVFSQKKIGDWSSAIDNLNKYLLDNI